MFLLMRISLKKIDGFIRYIVIFLIKVYRRFISPITPNSCRFYPTCSEYSMLAFKKYHFFKAFFLSFSRILRCNPFNEGGYDPLK